MASRGEPPRKKRAVESVIEFRFCLLCQGGKFKNMKCVRQQEHLRQPELELYQPACINNRANYQNPEYVRLLQNCV